MSDLNQELNNPPSEFSYLLCNFGPIIDNKYVEDGYASFPVGIEIIEVVKIFNVLVICLIFGDNRALPESHSDTDKNMHGCQDENDRPSEEGQYVK